LRRASWARWPPGTGGTGWGIIRNVLADKAFFSFTEVPRREDHRAYNEWHQLDHRPENLRLPGVQWGERWVHSPDCAPAAAEPDERLAALHYVNMYWFASPVDDATREWSALAERTLQQGRRADVHLATRLLMGFFRPIRGDVNRRVRVSEDVLPFRPNRGVHVHVAEVVDPRAPAAERHFERWDREHLPAVLRCDGVAGAWLFADDSTFATALDLTRSPSPSSIRITLAYLDGDPVEAGAAITDLTQAAADPAVARTLFSGPLRAITPWEWDWFG
jgi:hypothetical protein